MADITKKQSPRTATWVRVLLALSLALNLLVIGLVGGVMVRFGGPDGMRSHPRSIGAALFRAMPRAERRAIWAESKGPRGAHKTGNKDAVRAIGAALRATPFDIEVVTSVLDEHAQLIVEGQKSMQLAWVQRVAAMSDEKRVEYADRLERAFERGWHKRRRRDRD